MQYFMSSIVAYRTIDDETEIEHSPTTILALNKEMALRKAHHLAEDKWPVQEGWAHSVSHPVLITALVMALKKGVN